MHKRIVTVALVFFSLCVISIASKADEELLQLLIEEVESSVAGGDRETAQLLLEQITETASTLPSWVDERLAAASQVTEEQSEDYLLLQELQADFQAMLEVGDFESAAAVAEGAYFQAQDVFGPDHWLSISATRDYGFAAANLGDFETADTFYNEALALSSEVLGEGHPETQQMMETLARIYSAAGALEESMAIRELITTNYEADFGAWHMLTLRSMSSQIVTYEEAGDLISAVEMLRGLCGIYSASLTSYHSLTVECESRLGSMLIETGSLDEAVATYEQLITNLAASHSGITAFAIESMMNLGLIHEIRGEYQQGKELLSGLIATARMIGDEDLSYVGKNYLGRILLAEGNLPGAETVVTDVVGYGQAAWQNNPVQFFNTYLELGAIYQRQSKLSEAEAVFEESLVGLLETAGELHPSTLVAINNLGNVYEQMGLYDEAEPLLKQSLEGMTQTFGPNQ